MSKQGKRIPQFQWDSYRAMSIDVGRIFPFLGQTSCMNETERKLLAYAEGFIEIFGGDPRYKEDLEEFCKFLQEKIIPFLKKLGWAKFKRDIVSDLGFAKSVRRSKASNAKNLLEFEPTENDRTDQ